MHVLSGDVILILKDFKEIIFCEVKNFPRRGIGIPETEAVLKGPREGFNELIVDNVALIRRRIKNPDLKFETVVLGEESQTAVAIAYIKGIAPDELVNKVKDTDGKVIDVPAMLFNEIAPKYAGKNVGGYTRIVKAGPRRGDGAEVAILQLI